MEDLNRDANKVRVLACQKNNDQIDQTMLSNSKLFRKHRDAKNKFKRLIAQRTPTTVAIDINSSVASNLTESSMIESSIPSVVEVNTTNNSLMHRRQINFDNYLDNEKTRKTMQISASYTRQHLRNMKYCVEFNSGSLQKEQRAYTKPITANQATATN